MNDYNDFDLDTSIVEDFDELVYADHDFADDIAMIMERWDLCNVKASYSSPFLYVKTKVDYVTIFNNIIFSF
jgi:hypothetical protein